MRLVEDHRVPPSAIGVDGLVHRLIDRGELERDHPEIVGDGKRVLADRLALDSSKVAAEEALEALQFCTRMEGIIPALEPSHALAHVMKLAPKLPKDNLLVMNLCGRGDKDLFTVAKALGLKI